MLIDTWTMAPDNGFDHVCLLNYGFFRTPTTSIRPRTSLLNIPSFSPSGVDKCIYYKLYYMLCYIRVVSVYRSLLRNNLIFSFQCFSLVCTYINYIYHVWIVIF
jgi:hypothetical protein